VEDQTQGWRLRHRVRRAGGPPLRVIFARRQDARREGTGGARLGSHGHRPRDGGLLARRDAGQVTSGGRRVRRAGVRKDAAKLPHP